MRWIEFEGRRPTDADIPNWVPWTQKQWDDWKSEANRLLEILTRLHHSGLIEERNTVIDENRSHWSMLMPWLRALSLGKCWFTESYNDGSHMDVEHFRPKKSAKNADGTERDGYWWLAFDQRNYRLAGTVPNRMKGGWFPLHQDSCRSRYDARCEESETPALLDPTQQTDVNLIAYNDEGHAIAAPGVADAWDLYRVDQSIRRYKLNDHDPFPNGRRTIWQDMTREINSYLEAKASYRPGINPAPKAQMERSALAIRKMTRPEARFSTVARWCVQFRNDPHLTHLINA